MNEKDVAQKDKERIRIGKGDRSCRFVA